MRKLELIIKERRLRWLGHVLRMEDSRIPCQAIRWKLRGYKRQLGQPRKNWMDNWTSSGVIYTFTLVKHVSVKLFITVVLVNTRTSL